MFSSSHTPKDRLNIQSPFALTSNTEPGNQVEHFPELVTRANILLVDDRPENLLSLEAILDSLGQNLVAVTTGKEALRRMLEQEYAVVLLDVNLPEIDGFETAEIIRSRERNAHTPIIFLTAYDRTDVKIARGYELGAVDFIFKPFDPDVLRAKVNVFIELHRKTHQIRRLNETLERRVVQRTIELESANRDLRSQIAERHRAEAEVRRLNNHLEQLVRDRTSDLEAAYRELESFSYSVSHDLRAPVRRIDQLGELLINEYAWNADAGSRELLDRILAASRQMGHLIDDMLKLARVTRETVTMEPLDLSMQSRAIVAELRMNLADWKGSIVIDPDLKAWGDPHLVQLALQNLVDNAFKFTSRRTDPRIHIGKEDVDGTEYFFVRDNGAGFDEAMKGVLFQPFQRLHAASEFPGTGIGLAIVERVVARHGGRVWAKGEPDRGATFYFSLSSPSQPESDA